MKIYLCASKSAFDKVPAVKVELEKLGHEVTAANDAVLVLNFEKNGQPNYVGGAAFLEMFKAFDLGRKIYLYNPIPDGILNDEITGLQPVIINRDLAKVV